MPAFTQQPPPIKESDRIKDALRKEIAVSRREIAERRIVGEKITDPIKTENHN